MTGRNPEAQWEQIDTLEQKQNRIGDFNDFSDSGKRAFSDLSSELWKPKNGKEKYETSDIQDAASKHLDKMIDSSGVQVSKLNVNEKQKLEDIKKEMLANMDGKDPKTAIEEFGKIQEKVAGIIAAGEGKSQKTAQDFQQSQEKGKEENQKTKDIFEKFQDFLQDARKNQEEQQKRAREQWEKAQTQGNATSGVWNSEYRKAAVLELNANWP